MHGNLTKITQPAVSKPGATGAVSPVTTFAYVNSGVLGLLQSTTDAEGRTTRNTDAPTTYDLLTETREAARSF